jgi:hypothetical protein
MSEDSFQRMQQFPVIGALNERITRGDAKSLSPYADARNAGNKNGPAISRGSGVQRCLTTVRHSQPHAPKQCAVQ